MKHSRIKNVALVGCGACVFVWVLLVTYLYDSDPCRGKIYTAYLVRSIFCLPLKCLVAGVVATMPK